MCILPNAVAERISVSEPGTLHTLVTAPTTLSSLSVEGDIDARDLRYIASEMSALQSLDLSQVSIIAHDNDPAAHFPSCVFAGSRFTEIRLPSNGALSIGDMAFMASEVSVINIPESVHEIGVGAFAGCQRLKEVSFDGKTSLRSHAFADCHALSRVTLSSIDSIAEAVFSACGSLAEINGTENIMTLGAKAFAGCRSLASFQFGKGLRHIGDGAFASTGLTDIDLSDCCQLTEISPWSFAHCGALRSILLPRPLQNMSEALLFADSALPSLTLPSTVQNIDALAMARLDNLSELNAEQLSAVPQLGVDVWRGVDCPAVRLIVDSSMAQAFSAAGQWNEFDIHSTGALSSAEELTQESRVTWTIDGSHLIIYCASGLKSVKIYDLAGRLLASARPEANEYHYDISPRHTTLVIETSDSDNRTTADKILVN